MMIDEQYAKVSVRCRNMQSRGYLTRAELILYLSDGSYNIDNDNHWDDLPMTCENTENFTSFASTLEKNEKIRKAKMEAEQGLETPSPRVKQIQLNSIYTKAAELSEIVSEGPIADEPINLPAKKDDCPF